MDTPERVECTEETTGVIRLMTLDDDIGAAGMSGRDEGQADDQQAGGMAGQGIARMGGVYATGQGVTAGVTLARGFGFKMGSLGPIYAHACTTAKNPRPHGAAW